MIPRRRWYLEKYDPHTQRQVPLKPQEPLRIFWLRSTAWAESERLNASMKAGQWTARYRLRYKEK